MKKTVLLLAAFAFAPAVHADNAFVAGSTLTLRQCVEIALGNDPDIKVREYTAKAQEAVIGQARSAYLPNVSASAGYTSNRSTDRNLQDPFVMTIGTYDYKTAGVALNQLLFDFGKTPAAIRASKAKYKSARFDSDSQAVEVVSQVKQAYWALVFTKLSLRVSDEIVGEYKQQLSYAQAHFQANIRPKYDVTKAEADLSSAELDRIKSFNNVLLAKAYLTNMMNLADAPDYDVDASTEFVKYPADFDAIIAQAYARKPDLLSLQAQADMLEAQLKIARGDLYPALRASAGYNAVGSRSPLSQGWNAGLNLSADLFTGLRKTSKVTEQENQLKAIRSSIDSLKLQIYLSAKQSYLNLNQADQSITTAGMQVEQATENLDIANLRYKTGLGSPVEVSDATVLYNNAKMSLLKALYDYKTAQAKLEEIMGNKQ